MNKVYLVERDFKGEYERFALTQEEFEKTFPETVTRGEWPATHSDADTIAPLVHIWFCPVEIGSDQWNQFFMDMSWGLESDNEEGRLAYVRDEFNQSLDKYIPRFSIPDLEELREVLCNEKSFRYQLLSRMVADCKYYLGSGNKFPKHLWAGNEQDQIAYMKALYLSFSDNDKPEWLSFDQILDYEAKMLPERVNEKIKFLLGNRISDQELDVIKTLCGINPLNICENDHMYVEVMKDNLNSIRSNADELAYFTDCVKAEWVNLDEGWCGDYDPDDLEDENLLRFDVYVKREGYWEIVDDASYCTCFPASASLEEKCAAIQIIGREYDDALRSNIYASVKRLGERLSYISPDSLQPNITSSKAPLNEQIQSAEQKTVNSENLAAKNNIKETTFEL